MREDLQDKLYDRFSFLKCWIECGDGWFDLIWELSKDIEKEINKLTLRQKKEFAIAQIKEKYAGLRYSTTGIPIKVADKVFDLINEAKENSYQICEICSVPAELSIKGSWYKTLCKKCQKELGYRPTNWDEDI